MKNTIKPLALIAASILSLSLGTSARAATEAMPKTPVPAKAEKAPATAKVAKAMPMHTKVDTIDVATKSYTHTTQKGTKVTNTLTATSVVMQGDKPAQFSDIKVGDYVSGTHLKKSDTEYEIVKITKFGPEAPKVEKKAPAKKP
jgi:hypothetical protein